MAGLGGEICGKRSVQRGEQQNGGRNHTDQCGLQGAGHRALSNSDLIYTSPYTSALKHRFKPLNTTRTRDQSKIRHPHLLETCLYLLTQRIKTGRIS